MADFTTTYTEFDAKTVAAGRRQDAPLVDGPSSFLALAVQLGVPIFCRRKPGGGGTFAAGGGLSFAVSRAMLGMSLNKDVDWVNKISPRWFDRVAPPANEDGVITIKGYITKRIVLSSSRNRDGEGDGDEETFAAMTTEMRILAHEAIRQSQNIVALIGISWNTRETLGRFLPEALLEGAMHSSLSHYLQVSGHRLGFRDKALMLLDIASGMGFLHENGIVHCDVKLGNLLVCDSPERQSLGSLDVKPYMVKLCDFGCSVILSDYPDNHQFRLRVGTPGWMAPEMEQGLALDALGLLMTDMYSLGHVAAAVAVGTRVPLDVRPGVSIDKTRPTTNDSPEAESEEPERSVEFFVSVLLANKANHDLEKPLLALFSEILSCTLQLKPSDRTDASDIYRRCRGHLMREIAACDSANPLSGLPTVIERFRLMLPTCPGKPLAKAGVLGKVAAARVPDFAFETKIRSSLMSRNCRKEVCRDLERKSTGDSPEAGDCALQLAALVLNGYLDDEGSMKGKVERYLVKAIDGGSEVAMSGAINVLQAMGKDLPPDSRERILQRFRDPDFRRQGLISIKSLFFPLAYDTSPATPRRSGRAVFLYAHRQDINEKLIGFRSWAKEFKDEFDGYVSSGQYPADLYATILRILEKHGAVSSCSRRQPPFGSAMDRYVHDSEITLSLLDPHEQGLFARQIRGKDAQPNEPTEVGLTLLQLAVCRRDLLAAKTILEQSHSVDVNSSGTTPGWAPLWLACLLGHYELATLLIQHGADPACQDSVQGITLLHLLSQFSTREAVEGIGYQVLAAGVDVNTGFEAHQEEQHRVTPLLASMLVFDFSGGAAAAFLLANGACPLYFTSSFSDACALPVSPLSLCILDLDVSRLEAMLATDFPSWPRLNWTADARIAQSIGLQLMRTKTCFRAMLETGRNYKNLQSILRTVSCWFEARIFFWKPAWSPLGFAYDMDRADIMKLLLLMDPGASLDVCDGGESINFLEQCVVRHNFRSVKALIRHGADVLASTKLDESLFPLILGKPDGRSFPADKMQHIFGGETRLSRIAKDMPSVLGFVVDHLERLPPEQRGGRSVRNILTSWQIDTAGIFDTLVMEDGSEELVIAEALRVKYGLDHDRVQPFPPNATTLTGALIVWSNIYGYGRLDQIRYLLSLEPKPKFDLPAGINLLQLALRASEGTNAVEQIELIRLILSTYPDFEHLTRGRLHLLPPTFQAATGTNLDIIRLMEEHVRIKHPVKRFPYNHLHYRGESSLDGHPGMMTMLDACNLSIKDRGLVDPMYGYNTDHETAHGRQDKIRLGLVDQLGRHYSRKDIFRYLREKGAQLWYELDGYFISARMLWMSSVPTRKLYAFLQRTTVKHSLGPWVHRLPDNRITHEDVQSGGKIPDLADDMMLLASFPGTSTTVAQFQFLRMFELIWSENCLRLCVSDLAFPLADASTQIELYLSTRMEQRKAWGRIYGPGNPPYATADCLEPWIVKLDGKEDIDYLQYTRPGRIWAPAEVEGVAERVFSEWDEEFGGDEDTVPSELQGLVMSYF